MRSLLFAASVACGGGAFVSAQDVGGIPLARRFASSELTEDRILEALFSARLDNLRPIGTTSTTFQMQLAGTIDAAFKPETRLHPRGWAHEVAAYRIAGMLGLDQVPPARVRVIERGQLRRHIAPDYEGDVDALLAPLVFSSNVPGSTTIRGAAIYWVPNLERGTLDQPDGLARWTGWLEPGTELSPEQRILARDLASMCLFDALIGNGDRLSGGNLRTATNGAQRVIIRDHNLAFPARWSEPQRARVIAELTRARRFPRYVVEGIRALDRASLEAAVQDELGGALLDDAQIAAVLDRRDMVLSYVAALVEEHGEPAVLDL
ncbi:MAG: hypothetical protein OHK0013_22850 [Sandaracinaceae bacterium]